MLAYSLEHGECQAGKDFYPIEIIKFFWINSKRAGSGIITPSYGPDRSHDEINKNYARIGPLITRGYSYNPRLSPFFTHLLEAFIQGRLGDAEQARGQGLVVAGAIHRLHHQKTGGLGEGG